MADESLVIRGINWRETFPFTHIFRAFRVAIHPSKLVLALAALLLIYIGGRALDGFWPAQYTSTAIPIMSNDGLVTATIKTEGPFIQFFHNEAQQANNIVQSVLNGQLLGPDGMVSSALNFAVWGPVEAIRVHPVFFTILFVWFLIVWAIFGGAIARIAAVHVARDEKISVAQALRFSLGKFLSFIFAPLIPLLIVLAVGIFVAIGGLLLYIPYVGPVAVGLFFFIALAAGLVMTLLVFGTVGGFNLMYPTIAVEGSDSFDAISRSFSYIYARPWRMLWYTLVAIVYGALTYLFVRLFLFVMLGLTHYFVGWWVHGKDVRWNILWPGVNASSFWSLPYQINWQDLDWGQKTGAGILSFWIYLTIALLGAFAISFFFSANTIIYYLMRQEVDATELDDVYLEQADEEFADVTPPPSAPVPAAATPLVSPETQSAESASTPVPPTSSPDKPAGT